MGHSERTCQRKRRMTRGAQGKHLWTSLAVLVALFAAAIAYPTYSSQDLNGLDLGLNDRDTRLLLTLLAFDKDLRNEQQTLDELLFDMGSNLGTPRRSRRGRQTRRQSGGEYPRGVNGA